MDPELDAVAEALRRDLQRALASVHGRGASALPRPRRVWRPAWGPRARVLGMVASAAVLIVLFAALAMWGRDIRLARLPASAAGTATPRLQSSIAGTVTPLAPPTAVSTAAPSVTPTAVASVTPSVTPTALSTATPLWGTAGSPIVYTSLVDLGPSASGPHTWKSTLMAVFANGVTRTIATSSQIFGPAQWSPDGRALLYSDYTSTGALASWLWSPATGVSTPLLRPSFPGYFAQDGSIAHLGQPTPLVTVTSQGTTGQGYSANTLLDYNPGTQQDTSLGPITLGDGVGASCPMSGFMDGLQWTQVLNQLDDSIQYNPQARLALVSATICNIEGEMAWSVYDTSVHATLRTVGAAEAILNPVSASPDMITVSSPAQAYLTVMDARSGQSHTINFASLHLGAVQAATWSADGATIYALLRSGRMATIVSCSTDGGAMTIIGGGAVNSASAIIDTLNLTPDGSNLVFPAFPADISSTTAPAVYVVALPSGAFSTISTSGSQPAQFR